MTIAFILPTAIKKWFSITTSPLKAITLGPDKEQPLTIEKLNWGYKSLDKDRDSIYGFESVYENIKLNARTDDNNNDLCV